MTTFAEHVDDYLRLRRALGFKLEEHARLLPRFAAHLDAIGAAHITTDLALAWAVEQVVPAGSVVPAMRLLVARRFARYMAGIDPRTEVPPTGLIRLRRRRRPPFIYTDEQVLALMERARTGIRQRLVAATYETLIGLLAATGMRISEAIKLDHADIDWQQGVVLVRESKFNKSRYLPVHASATPTSATGTAQTHAIRASSSRCADDGSMTAPFTRRFDGFATRPASGRARRFRPGSMTSGTRWPSRRCSAGTARASMSTRVFRPCRPTSGI
jgi:integrase/recombinase XerD